MSEGTTGVDVIGPPMEAEFHTSRTVGQIGKALAAAQGEIENASATSENPHFKSHYADLASIIDAVRGPLAKYQIARHQACLSRVTEIGIEAGVRTTLIHTSGEWISSAVYCKPDRTGAQAMGAVITYLRRYSLAAAVGLAQDDDDGESAMGRGKVSRRTATVAAGYGVQLDTTLAQTQERAGAVPAKQFRDLVECRRWSEVDQDWIALPLETRLSGEQAIALETLRGELGIDDPSWSARLRKNFAKEGLRDLSEGEAATLIEKLEARKVRHGTAAEKTARKWSKAVEGDKAHASAAEVAEYMTGSPTGDLGPVKP